MKRDTKIGVIILTILMLTGIAFFIADKYINNNDKDEVFIRAIYLTNYSQYIFKSGEYGHFDIYEDNSDWQLGDIIEIADSDIMINGKSFFEIAKDIIWKIIRNKKTEQKKEIYILTISERAYSNFDGGKESKFKAIDYLLHYLCDSSKEVETFLIGGIHFNENGDIGVRLDSEYAKLNIVYRSKSYIESERKRKERIWSDDMWDEELYESGLYGENPYKNF